MPKTPTSLLTSPFRWLIRRPSYMLLTADDEPFCRQPARRFKYAWVELVLISLAAGLLLVGVYSGAWKLFRDYGVIIMPIAAVVAVFSLWLFRRAMLATAELIGGKNHTARALAACVLVVMLALFLLRLRHREVPDGLYLPAWAAWIRPYWKHERVLLLMPLWGAWAMIITGQFCKPNERTEPAIAAFVAGCGPLAAAACMGLLMAASIIYFSFLSWWQLSIPLAAVLAAVVGGLVICRATGGINRRALLCGNLLTQLVFLLAYLANQNL